MFSLFNGRLKDGASIPSALDSAYAAYGAAVRARAANRERVVHLNFADWYNFVYKVAA